MSTKNNQTSPKLFVTDNAPIFRFINPNSNDQLSNMSGHDLQTLITLLDDYYLQLRSRLGLDNYITFGLEIEFEETSYLSVKEKIDEAFHDRWVAKADGSLTRGAEINSPILHDNETTWNELAKVCKVITPLGKIYRNSGGHIHIGAQTLGDNKESWLNLLRLWSAYENIIYRFTYGNFLTGRASISKYAEPMSKTFWHTYKTYDDDELNLYDLLSTISSRRNQAINFDVVDSKNVAEMHEDNTIEFRCPNSSFDPVIWQNNVNLLVNILLYSKCSKYDGDIIDARHYVIANKYDSLRWYDEVYLEQALELCDLLFNNNFDKIYFLKQYLKSFQVQQAYEPYTETKKMTKDGIKVLSRR